MQGVRIGMTEPLTPAEIADILLATSNLPCAEKVVALVDQYQQLADKLAEAVSEKSGPVGERDGDKFLDDMKSIGKHVYDRKCWCGVDPSQGSPPSEPDTTADNGGSKEKP